MSTTVEKPAPRPMSAEEERLRADRRRRTLHKWFWRIAGYVVILGTWEFLSDQVLDSKLYPSPSHIVVTFGEIWASGRLLESFAATLTRIGVGFGISFLVGAIVGLVAQIRWFDAFFKDAVVIGLTTPSLVWALTGLIIWGFEPQGWIFAIVLTTFALVTVNVAEGVRALPKDLIDMAKAFGVSTLQRQRQIVIPHLAPFLFTGIRFGFSIAWKVTVLTEVFSASKGIGYEMRVTSQLFRIDEFFTWALAFFAFALFLEKAILQRAERRFFRWRQEVTSV